MKHSEMNDDTHNEDVTTKDLSSGIVEYLSKEIETTTNNLMTFRTRISFAVLIGPFVVLGSFLVAAKGIPMSLEPGRIGWVAIGFEGLCFLTLAYVCARIEGDAWRQCDEWRQAIAALHKDPSVPLQEAIRTKGVKKPLWKGKSWTLLKNWLEERKLKCAYLIAYFLIFASLVAVVFIISKVKVQPEHHLSADIARPAK
ncbi:MAG TPA: hypothetical protein VGO56_02245 [Pyrinomonadaceae bacterium]|jgi:hypothetical protein|nr:hypothetical protein [Pyrinomonadaceae bacterium]